MPVLPRLGLRRSSIVIGAVIIFVLAGLYATDRVLTQAARERLRIDAAESATLVESFLSQRAEALTVLRALYADGHASSHRLALAEYTVALTDFLPGIRRLWVADSSGKIVDDVAMTGGEHLPAADMDTIHSLGLDELAARARSTTRPLLSHPGRLFGDADGVVMMMPLCSEPRRGCAGFVAALLSSDEILGSATRDGPLARSELTVIAGGDTVGHVDNGASRTADVATTRFPAPDGTTWRVVLRHDTNVGRSRALVWTIGLFALAALAWGMARERRDALQAAERSRELERLSTEALRANRAKSEFLANVSHELRTPLNAIVGFVDLLRDGVYGALAPRQVAPVDRIAASAGHLRHLVDQVLDIAKMAAGRLEVHQESVDLRPFVLDVATEVEPLVSEKHLAIKLSVPALPRVRTDPTHLRQILVNLIGNAVKYTPAGSILVRARYVDAASAGASPDTTPTYSELQARSPDLSRAWIALQVIDTGIGIAPADHARIFEEFEQVNAGPRGDSMHRGTGLGLPISRRLARLLGGEVTVQSELGKGATFTLWIPGDRSEQRANPPRATAAGSTVGPSPVER